MNSGGYILLYRKLQDHWLWQDDKMLKWWLIILFNVNHSPSRFPVDGEIHTCNPGQSFRSLDNWSSLFGCSKKTTVKFFQLLEDDEMISRQVVGNGNRRKHLLSVVNWKDYQLTETENYSERVLKTPPKIPSNNKGRIKEKEEEINIPFENFFNEYHKTTGLNKSDKISAQKYWNKLNLKEREKALVNIKPYYNSLKDPFYCKKARTYLSDRNFDDEFTSFQKINGSQIITSTESLYEKL